MYSRRRLCFVPLAKRRISGTRRGYSIDTVKHDGRSSSHIWQDVGRGSEGMKMSFLVEQEVVESDMASSNSAAASAAAAAIAVGASDNGSSTNSK